jgi:hypothetical protein
MAARQSSWLGGGVAADAASLETGVADSAEDALPDNGPDIRLAMMATPKILARPPGVEMTKFMEGLLAKKETPADSRPRSRVWPHGETVASHPLPIPRGLRLSQNEGQRIFAVYDRYLLCRIRRALTLPTFSGK